MSRKHTLAGLALAAMMAVGVASTAVAETDQNGSETTLDDGAGTNICALNVNSGAAFNFGTYVYDGADYLQGASRASAVNFTVVLTTDDHPTDCSVTVLGTNLTNTPYAIPVGRISLAQNGSSPVTVSTVAALNATTPSTLIASVSNIDPLGNGTANVTTTLTLTNADDINPPGTYQGTISFTSTPAVP